MRLSLLLLFLIISNLSSAQDSVHIKGRVIDENGRPIANVYVLFSMFYKKWYDWIGPRKDTFLTDAKGNFTVDCKSSQLWRGIYYKKEGFMPAASFIKEKTANIILDSPVVLKSRKSYLYDSREINESHLGMTVQQAIDKYKVDLHGAYFKTYPWVRAFITELADSSYVLLVVPPYYDSTRLGKSSILNKKIIGIGVADIYGNKKFIGKGFSTEKEVRNEYLDEQKRIKEEAH